ncbi:MAG: pyridoxal-dependent decarboxylase [Gammaproteobacteria bacterium]|nr:pyridoxal-dependent decarboxylase [Gammaproteobacteria bacterium]
MAEPPDLARDSDALTPLLEELAEGFAELPLSTGVSIDARARDVLHETAQRLQDNFPYFHPLYAGQMLKPPHPVARVAYQLAMSINPNNHALDGGRASSAMEKEAVAGLADMFGWQSYLGHLTSGGTMANLEALWVAGQLAPGTAVLGSEQAHYTHARISQVLKLPYESVASDARGRMSTQALAQRLRGGGIGTVVATLGTTGYGAVDPLPDILKLREEFGFRVHVDAAYGGYYALADNLEPETRASFDAIGEADSIVVDPHKHGLQPYGCGSVLFKDASVGRFYRHDSPYTYFSSDELHLGEISLECSRAGAAAAALWATQRLLPLNPGGEFARDLERCRGAALALFARLQDDPRYLTAFAPELDIIIWGPRGASAEAVSAASRAQFEAAARHNLHLALIEVPVALLLPYWGEVALDGADSVTCLRSCLMKPEHLDWVDRIWQILDELGAG